ncbi:MAG: hypothetical protein M3178_02730 [Pseudomonadota bacterium]|nr:hypothetical protein [Pseudomonadota bacterium]
MLDQLPDLREAGSGRIGLANLFRVPRRFPGKPFLAEDTAPTPPGFARMFLIDPYDLESRGIPVLENTGVQSLNRQNCRVDIARIPAHL